MMQYRNFGKTGWQVSEIGFGAWGIGGGWGQVDDAEALRALDRAFALGLNFVDTAYVYGDGHSEEIISKALRGRSERVYVATKVPPKTMVWPVKPDVPVTETFPVDWVTSCAEESLARLGVDAIDLLQLHAWTDAYNDQLDWYEAMVKLREQGKVRAFGVSINDRDPESGVRLAQSGRVDAIQLIFNIFHQEPTRRLLPACREHGVAGIVRVPFEEGALTGRFRPGTTFEPGDWRGEYFTEAWLREIDAHLKGLETLLGPEAPDLPALALKYCLADPAIAAVIPGMRSVRHVEANAAASDGQPLSAATLKALQEHDWPHGVEYPWVKG
jgi:aryl-alcohol dehydrogenase-like predicted oxidoreductase